MLTLRKLVSNERAVWSVLILWLGDHHGGERSDEAVVQGHVQGLGCGICFLIGGTTLAET